MFNLGLSNYVLTWGLGSLTYVAYYTIPALPLTLLVYIVVPKLAKKYDRMKLFRIFLGILIAVGIATFFVGYRNWIWYGVFFILRTVMIIACMMMLLTFATDFVEYGNYKTGMRKEGLTFAVQTFATKCMGALAAALTGIALGLIGFNAELPAQSDLTMNWLWILSCFSPMLGIFLGLPFLAKCNYNCSDMQIMADINAGRISREEGESMMSQTY